MKLYHWNAQGIAFLVLSTSEEDARSACLQNAQALKWIDQPRYVAIVRELDLPPFFVADAGHVIAIDSVH